MTDNPNPQPSEGQVARLVNEVERVQKELMKIQGVGYLARELDRALEPWRTR